MNIKVNNIGIINNADIKLDGLTIITGLNNTGKSTVGKIAYGIIQGNNNIDMVVSVEQMRIFYERIKKYGSKITKIVKSKKDLKKFDIDMNRIDTPYRYFIDKDRSAQYIKTIKDLIEKTNNLLQTNNLSDDEKIINFLKETLGLLDIDKNSKEIKYESIKNGLNREFQGDLENKLNKNDSKIELWNNNVLQLGLYLNKENKIDYQFMSFNNAIYIDTPFVFDFDRYMYFDRYDGGHRNDLKSVVISAIQKDDAILNVTSQKLINEINKIIPGKFKFDKDVKYSENNITINSTSLAAGLQEVGIIKILLEKSIIDSNSLMILDEPENHLHPKLQMDFAKVLIRIVKELELTLLITTHSPYMIQALNVYAKNYNIEDKTNFYIAIRDEKGATYKNINDNLEETFKLLAEPFAILQDKEWND